jgi:hypothetical protein
MLQQNELRMFLTKTMKGTLRLEAEDGGMVLEGPTYRELRRELDQILRACGTPLHRVKLLIGAPPRRQAVPWPRLDPSPETEARL